MRRGEAFYSRPQRKLFRMDDGKYDTVIVANRKIPPKLIGLVLWIKLVVAFLYCRSRVYVVVYFHPDRVVSDSEDEYAQ